MARFPKRSEVGSYCTVALLLIGFAQSFIGQSQDLAWVGTWAAAPMRDGSGRSFSKQTLRQIVHTSVSGSFARIHISNVFGTQPLIIDDVHIAFRDAGSSTVAGTDRQFQFAGLPSVTIAPGATVVSDSLTVQIAPLSDVAISIYFPMTTGPATYHPAGFQTNYIAGGDVSGDTFLSDVQTTQSYYFLTNLDIQGKAASGSIVALGASITDGYASAQDSNRRWPNDLAERLSRAKLKVGVLNEGIGGNRLLTEGAGDSAETRFDRDVLEQPGVRWVIFSDDPINDLGSTRPPPSGDQLIESIDRLIVRAHQKKIKFYCSTLTPYQGAGYWTQEGEAAREHINSFIRSSSSGCDGVIDQDAATHDPAHPEQFLPAFDSGDHLHPNTAGLQAIANAVDLALFLVTTGRETSGQSKH
jgi:lysophospholipase L1-like esterase